VHGANPRYKKETAIPVRVGSEGYRGMGSSHPTSPTPCHAGRVLLPITMTVISKGCITMLLLIVERDRQRICDLAVHGI